LRHPAAAAAAGSGGVSCVREAVAFHGLKRVLHIAGGDQHNSSSSSSSSSTDTRGEGRVLLCMWQVFLLKWGTGV
jgi:hypothetical protein